MNPLRILVGLPLALTIAVTLLLAEGDPPKPSGPGQPSGRPAFVVIFDFQSPGLATAGEQLARSVFGKLSRQQKRQPRTDMTIIDPLTARQAGTIYKIGFAAAPARVASVLAGELAANVAVVGHLARAGGDYTVRVRLIDLRANADDWLWEKTFTASGERARGRLADQITEAISGLPVAKPLEVGHDPEPAKLGPTVTANGDFQQAKGALPAGWGPIDNLTAFWVDDPSGRRGRGLRINTDVYEWQWKAWRAKLAGGAPLAEAPRRVPTRGPKYDTVAGTYGIHVYNDYIRPKPRMRYRVLADFKGKTTDFFFPKIFVKGYVKYTAKDELQKEQYREVWRTYLALRNFENQWKHYSQTLRPPENVQKLRLIVYAYWPPGVYEFDNVRLVEEPLAASRPAASSPPSGR